MTAVQQDRWNNGGDRGLAAGVSIDGGSSWSVVPLPFSACASNAPAELQFGRASDPWVSFGPGTPGHPMGATAYSISISFNQSPGKNGNTVGVAASYDGGFTWTHAQSLHSDAQSGVPIPVPDNNFQFFHDKESVTANPKEPDTAYAVWDVLIGPNANIESDIHSASFTDDTLFSRTTDFGATWSPVRITNTSANPTTTRNQTIGNIIVVDPRGGGRGRERLPAGGHRTDGPQLPPRRGSRQRARQGDRGTGGGRRPLAARCSGMAASSNGLDPERRLVRGLVVNRFRGDRSLFADGVRFLEVRSRLPVLGVVPWFDVRLPAEDSLDLEHISRPRADALLDVAVVALGRISNFDELESLAAEPGVSVRLVSDAARLGSPDLLILPGSKTTVADLRRLRENRLADALLAAHAAGSAVLGICAGYQILGREIRDPDHVESPTGAGGLGLLPTVTTFEHTKITSRRQGLALTRDGLLACAGGVPVSGHEIRMGRISGAGRAALEIEGSPEGAVSEDGWTVGTSVHGRLPRAEPRRIGPGSDRGPPVTLTIVFAAVTAFVLDARHGLDWDHLSAIADMVGAPSQRSRRSLGLALWYCIGRGSVIVLLGTLVRLLGVRLPGGLDRVFEVVVGLTLIGLGLLVLVQVARQGRRYRLTSRWRLLLDLLRRVLASEAPRSRVGQAGRRHLHAGCVRDRDPARHWSGDADAGGALRERRGGGIDGGRRDRAGRQA